MKLALRGFTGIVPKTDTELLPANAATVARDCYLDTGTIAPLNGNALVQALGNAGVISIYRMVDAPDPNTPVFLSFTAATDVVRVAMNSVNRYVITGNGVPQQTTYALATSGTTGAYPRAVRALGLPTPPTTPNVAPPLGGTPVSRSYTYTWLTDWTEESQPAVASAPQTGDANNTWTIQMSAPPTTFNGLPLGPIRRRLYRTEGTSATFQLVAEEPAVGAWTNNTFVDNLLDTANASNPGILGDALISSDWAPPPIDMIGAVLHPSGMVMGFSPGSNIVNMSESFQPHAYPPQYQLMTEYPIVGIGVSGSSVVILTTMYPYLVVGTEPGSMYLQQAGEPLPCLSKRSIIGMGSAVVFASNYGLVQIDLTNGTQIVTQTIFDYKQWDLRDPSGMIGAYAKGRLHFFSPSMTSDAWLMLDARQNIVQTSSATAVSFHTDTLTGELLFVNQGNIGRFDDPTIAPTTYTWTSKEFVMPHPMSMGAARIRFAPASSFFSGATDALTINVYANQVLVLTLPVTDEKPFRLPSGFKTHIWQVSITGNARVQSIEVAETVQNLDSLSQIDLMGIAQ